MKDATIISPSYKRADGLLSHLLFPGLVYCVGEAEQEEYRARGVEIMTCPDEVNGNIARARNWILDQYRGENVLIVDDDIKQLCRWTEEGGRWKPKNLNPEEAKEFIRCGFGLCKEMGARLWGINPASDRGGYKEYTPFSMSAYTSGSFSGFVEPELRYDERIPLKEDYDMTIQQCNTCRRVLRLNMYHMKKDDHGNVGGCAAYRTLEREREQLKLLQAKWGAGIVREDLGKSCVQRKKEITFDINPIIRVPIGGV